MLGKNINFIRNLSKSFQIKPYQVHKFDKTLLPNEAVISTQEAKKLFFEMSIIRNMEQELSRLYKEKLIRGFCHLYSGQEACCVGMEAALVEGDSIITAYRSHGWTYTRGQTVHSIIAELLGKETGCSKGYGGSMHTFAKDFYGGNGIVGAQVPLGAGIGLTNKYLKNNKISIALYGDGAANQGQIFEAYNIAALWKLPVIFVCENNLYGMGTTVDRASFSTEFYTRGDYIPGIKVDGNCVLSVKEATKAAAEYVRNGNGPLVMELMTYRYFGHSMSDPGTSYRKKEEVQERRAETDPIKTFKNLIVQAKLVTEEELDKLNQVTLEEVEMAKEKALLDKFPQEKNVANNILCDGNGFKVRGCDQYTWFESH